MSWTNNTKDVWYIYFALSVLNGEVINPFVLVKYKRYLKVSLQIQICPGNAYCLFHALCGFAEVRVTWSKGGRACLWKLT